MDILFYALIYFQTVILINKNTVDASCKALTSIQRRILCTEGFISGFGWRLVMQSVVAVFRINRTQDTNEPHGTCWKITAGLPAYSYPGFVIGYLLFLNK